MVVRIAIALALLALAGVVAVVLERRRAASSGAGATIARDEYAVPRQIDRADFPRPDAPWLVVLFSADRCESCADVRPKVAVLGGADVAVFDAEEGRFPELHRRYDIDAAPLTLVADAEGVVVEAFLGRVSATDLWAAVAEARFPGSRPPGGCQSHAADDPADAPHEHEHEHEH